MSAIRRLWFELRRRNVLKAGGVYAVAAFVVLQLGEIVLPAFDTPAWTMQALVVGAFLGLPVTLCVAWAYNLVPGARLQRTSSGQGEDAGPVAPRLALLAVTAGSATLAAFWLGRTTGPQGLPAADAGATADERADPSPELPAVARFDPLEAITAVAVLPLADLAEGDDLFARQLHDEIVNELARTTTLRVASRASAERYADTDMTLPQIARDLRVQAVVTGSVSMTAESDSVRVSVQLLHAESDTHLLTKTFQREMKDVLRLQTEIAAEIAAAVRGEVEPGAGGRVADQGVGEQPGAPAASPAAIRAYLRGREALRRERPQASEALEHFGRAVAADSAFAAAWAGLAEAGLASMLAFGPGGLLAGEAADQVADALRKAEQLGGHEEELAPVRVVLSGLRGEGGGSGRDSLVGMHVRDLPWIGRQAAVRDGESGDGDRGPPAPDSRYWQAYAGAWTMANAGRYDSAAALFQMALDADSARQGAWHGLEEMHLMLGDYGEAAEVRARAALATREGATPPEERAQAIREAFVPGAPASYWRALERDMQLREAHGDPVAHLERARTALGLGDEEGAIEHLERAVAERERVLGELRRSHLWDPLRGRSELRELIGQARRSMAASRPPRGAEPGGG